MTWIQACESANSVGGRILMTNNYEIMSDHFKDTKGYGSYATAADAFKAVGLEVAARAYCSVNSWGTPERIIEQLRARRELIGDFELSVIVNYGGMPHADAEASMRLFASDVLPEIQSW